MRPALTLTLLLVASVFAEETERDLPAAKAAFTKADKNLNDAWTAIRKERPESVFAELKIKQREWIEARDRQALESSAAPKDEAAAKRAPEYWITATKLTEERAQWLQRLARNDLDTSTGLWVDGNSGMIEIVERKNQLLFVFHVVRRSNVGILAGVAVWNRGIGWFSDKGREPDKTDETNISFVERYGKLEVVGANTEYYHGHHAYFDGTYFQIAPLSEKEERDVVTQAERGEAF
jgi:uncharacterized protein YecT (DUF1311 family)